MSKPRLCIDIDNVIAQTDAVMRQVIGDYTEGRVNLLYHHVRNFDYAKCSDARGHHITDDEWHEIHKIFSRTSWISAVEPYPSVQTILARLSERYELHFATSRLTEARKATVEWLDNHRFPPHRLHFLIRGEKHVVLGGVHSAIEDDPVQALGFAKIGARCYVLAHPWNRQIRSGPYVERTRNWTAIEQALLEKPKRKTRPRLRRAAL